MWILPWKDQEEVFMRPVVFAVHPEVREGEERESRKGPKEGRILGRASKKARKKKPLLVALWRAQRQLMCPRVTVPWKLQQKSPMGKDILLSPMFFFFFKFSSKEWQEHEANCYLCSREKTHMRTSVLRSCFKNNHRRGVCLQSAAGDLQSSGKWDSSGALSADSPKCLQDCVHLYSLPNHPTLTPVGVLQIEGGAVSMFSAQKHWSLFCCSPSWPLFLKPAAFKFHFQVFKK